MTRSLTARTRVLAVGAALLIAVGTLTGCTDRPGQAADMKYTGLDGASHSIVVTEKDIDVVAKELEPKPGQQTEQERKAPTRVDIAGALIEAPLITEVGQAHGITITDAEIVQLAKEQLGLEPRQASTLAYLRANVLFNQLRQQQDQAQAIVADLSKLRATLTGDRSPRYPDKAPEWWTQEDPRQQQTPQQGGQQQPQQQVPQQGGQQQPQQQQVPQQGGQQQPQQQQVPQQSVPQEGAEQPADPGQTEGQTNGDQGAGDGAAQPGQADGGAGAGEGGQGADQSEG